MKLLTPRERHRSIQEIDFASLKARGIRGLIFDLDNTLALWRAGPPKPEVEALLLKLRDAGFRVAILSNGRLSSRPQVLERLAELGIPVIWPARKPLARGFKAALAELGTSPEETAMIGDQLFTDVLGGNRAGLYTILVEPLDKSWESLFTRLNRLWERLLRRGR